MDFEKSVLTELRETVEEVDPIDWLMSLADSDAGYNGKAPNNSDNSKNNNKPSNNNKPKPAAAMSDWDSITDVLDTLSEIQQM